MNILVKAGSILAGGAVISILAGGGPQNSIETPSTVSTAREQLKTVPKLSTATITPQNESTSVKEQPSTTVVPEATSDTRAKPKPASSCHPSYSGCLKINTGDYDCSGGSGNGPNYIGPVQVYSSDPFDLDRDNDGWGCE